MTLTCYRCSDWHGCYDSGWKGVIVDEWDWTGKYQCGKMRVAERWAPGCSNHNPSE